MQVQGVDFTESFSSITLDTPTSILIGLTLYFKDNGWIAELCEIEAAFLHTNMEVEMYIEWPEGVVYLEITNKEFRIEYCSLLGKSIYGNVDAAQIYVGKIFS